MELDLACVDSFVAVAAALHFGRAAAQLHLTTSALTKRIQKLETQLGVQLIDRGPAGTVSLTGAGDRFSPHALTLLEEARVARLAARNSPAPTDYRLGLPGQLQDHPELVRLPSIAAAVRRANPSAVIHCYGIPFPFVLRALLDGTIDVMWDVSTTDHPRVESIPLQPFERVGVVSIDHPLAEADEVPVEEFAQLPMLFGRGVPEHWMARFYLGDVRPVERAQLVAINGGNSTDVKANLAIKLGVTTAPVAMAQSLGSLLTTVKLAGVPLVPSFATRKRGDDRESVLGLINALESIQTMA
jgi:DNA-binding transcriptional LysR family regulator